jgi:hypothetical protein
VACSQAMAGAASFSASSGLCATRRKRRPARVVERAQHARHVAQRRALGAPLLEAARGLAFEVDDDEVVVRHQHLAQVVVAVEAALQRRAASALAHEAPLGDVGLQRIGGGQQPCWRRPAPAAARRCARAAAPAWRWRRWWHARGSRSTSVAASGSGSKAAAPVRVASARCSSAVRRPSVCHQRQEAAVRGQHVGRGGGAVGGGARRQEALQVAQRVVPAVALVGHVACTMASVMVRRRWRCIQRAQHGHAVGVCAPRSGSGPSPARG